MASLDGISERFPLHGKHRVIGEGAWLSYSVPCGPGCRSHKTLGLPVGTVLTVAAYWPVSGCLRQVAFAVSVDGREYIGKFSHGCYGTPDPKYLVAVS